LHAYASYFRVYRGDDAVTWLFRVACGLESQIVGEGQILTQLKSAAATARELECSDSVLQTLFRLAITAGKAVRTRVRPEGAPTSIAESAVRRAESHFGTLSGRSAVVIGNGATGRLCAELLRARGCSVTVTLRSYKHGETVVPKGCATVAYGERFGALELADILFSATSGAHLTLALEQYAALRVKPQFIADLAVPFDTDRRLKPLPGLTLIDMDDFDDEGLARQVYSPAALEEIESIAEQHIKEFKRWLSNRNLRLFADPPRFPLFIDLRGRKCVVIGCGKIGTRRARALLDYGASVTIIDPAADFAAIDHAGVTSERREFEPSDLDGAFLAIAATNVREVNRAIAEQCRRRGVFVSVADSADECTFWFPALCSNERLSVGLVSRDGAHSYVADSARRVRALMEEL
jgi:siroheme synthase-like protein